MMALGNTSTRSMPASSSTSESLNTQRLARSTAPSHRSKKGQKFCQQLSPREEVFFGQLMEDPRHNAPAEPRSKGVDQNEHQEIEDSGQQASDPPENPCQSASGNLEDNQSNPTVGYRTQYKNVKSGDVVLEKYDTNGFQDPSTVRKGTAFDIVRVFHTSQERGSTSTAEFEASLAPAISMHISSSTIINALRSVVRYYPGQDLTSDIVIVPYPYPVLVHHFDELCEFRRQRSKKDSSVLCVRERDADRQIGVLIDYLEKNIMPSVREERERNKKGLETWEWLWVRMKPGNTWFFKWKDSDDWTTAVIESVTGGTLFNQSTMWKLTQWSLNWDGMYLGRMREHATISRFDGERDCLRSTRMIETQDLADTSDEDVQRSIRYGTLWWNVVQKQCKYVKGKTSTFPYNEIEGNVMADLESYYSQFQEQIPFLDHTEARSWTSDCTCRICNQREAEGKMQKKLLFDEYDRITRKMTDRKPLTPHMVLLCPCETWVFVFKTRTWEKVHVKYLSEPQFQEEIIDHLVMDERRKTTLKALAKSFARYNVRGKEIHGDPWSADFVKGKGNGLIFLLHGSPGVGKTYTAECIAAFTKRPLMVLTSSDIGTDPQDVELNLSKNFKTARSWGAVLLIDEADVFMETRSTSDLNRNSLVAAFLRALEFYDGILFLTTNRVGSFDDAFVSRVHVKLYYPDFTANQRRQVWQTFVDKLEKERGDYIRLQGTAEDYLDGEEIQKMAWNGREIRNAFQTAISLAEYDDERDKNDLILVQRKHLSAVVELSRDFKDYLDDLHQGDEAKRSERKYERLCRFGGDK